MNLLCVGERNVEPKTGVGTIVIKPKPFLVVGLETIGDLIERICLPVTTVIIGDVGLGKGYVGLHGEKRVQPSEVGEKK